MPVRPVLAFVAAFVCPANDSPFEPLYAVLKFRWRLSVAGTAALSVLTISYELQVAPFAMCSLFFIFT